MDRCVTNIALWDERRDVHRFTTYKEWKEKMLEYEARKNNDVFSFDCTKMSVDEMRKVARFLNMNMCEDSDFKIKVDKKYGFEKVPKW